MQVSQLVSEGAVAAEKEVNVLTELLMDQLLRLDAIIAEGELKVQKRKQITRIQKLIESLDELKLKKSMPTVLSQKSTPSVAVQKSAPPPKEVDWGSVDLLSGPPMVAAVKLEWELF